MSNDIRARAMRAANRAGTPYVHRTGNQLALVLSVKVDFSISQMSGQVLLKECSSAGLARAVAARVLGDLERNPQHRDRILDVSALLVRSAPQVAAAQPEGA